MVTALQQPTARIAGATAAVAAAAADSLTPSATIIGGIVVAVVAASAAVWSAATALRTFTLTSAHNAAQLAANIDKAHDDRVDAENVRLRIQVDAHDQLVERYRELQERHARLRLAVIQLGHDPELIATPRPKGTPGDPDPAT